MRGSCTLIFINFAAKKPQSCKFQKKTPFDIGKPKNKDPDSYAGIIENTMKCGPQKEKRRRTRRVPEIKRDYR